MTPLIGYTIEPDDRLFPLIERVLRQPLDRAGALAMPVSRWTPLEHVERVLDMLDGIQLCGGADVDPAHYGEEQHPLTGIIEPHQDLFELALIRGAFARGMPVLGVCRGAQVVGVASGGTLVQDVETLHPGAGTHRNDWYALATAADGPHMHVIETVPGSGAERWLAGGPPRVNSFHHQAVATVGEGFAITARAPDGSAEVVERVDGHGFAVGLQWHNELLWERDQRFLRPHLELVEAARAYAAGRTLSVPA